MIVEMLLSWWNLIFVLPFGLGLLYLGMYTLSGWTFGDADTDTDAGVDHDMDAHLDADGNLSLDHDTDLSHDIQADADTDSDAHDAETQDAHASAFLSALNWIGVGRMPLSLVLMIFMLSWGTIGFALNQVQRDRPIDQSITIAIAAAGIGSAFITHFVSSILGRALFNTTNVPRRRHELLGSHGEALYPIDSKFGMVCGRDDRGDLFQVACRVEAGQEPVAKGAAVQLVAYSAADRMFFVVPAEDAITPRIRRKTA